MKRRRIVDCQTIQKYSGATRELLKLECGHVVEQALRPTKRKIIICPECEG